MLNIQTSRKITSLCEEFSFTQVITEPTHFTENSASLIDVNLASNPAHIVSSGVRDRFLQQDIRFRCPVFGILNFSKPKRKSFTCHIWRYDHGDYNLFRQKVVTADWSELKHENIDTYANGFTDNKMDLAKSCIPNKIVTI